MRHFHFLLRDSRSILSVVGAWLEIGSRAWGGWGGGGPAGRRCISWFYRLFISLDSWDGGPPQSLWTQGSHLCPLKICFHLRDLLRENSPLEGEKSARDLETGGSTKEKSGVGPRGLRRTRTTYEGMGQGFLLGSWKTGWWLSRHNVLLQDFSWTPVCVNESIYGRTREGWERQNQPGKTSFPRARTFK